MNHVSPREKTKNKKEICGCQLGPSREPNQYLISLLKGLDG
jgi:hypothetical protein